MAEEVYDGAIGIDLGMFEFLKLRVSTLEMIADSFAV